MAETKKRSTGAERNKRKREQPSVTMDRDAMRARKREERRKKVRRQKILLSVATLGIMVLAAAAIVLFMPSMRLSRALAKGSEYVQAADYASAQQAYEEALDIDSASVKAYRGLAENYLAQKDAAAAESNLYLGWENTQDESLLNYYCTVVLNEAVAEINEKKVTLDTMDKCIQILEIDAANSDALSLADTGYQRFFSQMGEEACRIFDDSTQEESCQYPAYEELVRRLLKIYETAQTPEVQALLQKYALADAEKTFVSVQHLDSYLALLQEVSQVTDDAETKQAIECLTKAKEEEAYFAEAFSQFEAGNYEYARELVSSDAYMQLRDSFIKEESGCWEGSIYIPVNQERLVLHRTEEGIRFYFPNDAEDENVKDLITVWGSKQEDDGVQRSVISYEPMTEEADDQHTEYTIQYLYSNVKIDGQYVPQMNYRFDTKVTNAQGEAIATTAIGDWGGEHEWEIDY